MGHYKSNVRDLEFNLFEVFGRREILGTGLYADLDEDVVREHPRRGQPPGHGRARRLLRGGRPQPAGLRPRHRLGDDAGGLQEVLRRLLDGRLGQPRPARELGGPGLPAQPGLGARRDGPRREPGPLDVLQPARPSPTSCATIGTDAQKRFAELAIERQWGATMVLTEPDAGSDVGAGRAKAVRQPDGTWHIEGVKRFITSAEHDMTENIFHLVLARPEGHGPGTKGLSMFLVPKFHVDLETGELGERNGVYVTNVEKKMGLKVSTTCELTFGDKHPAMGWLVGEVHEGIKQMFMIIEHARMMVGTKAIATLSTGYLNALEYAKERRAGRRPDPDDRQVGPARAPSPTTRTYAAS